jgi:hypothetical protein
MHTDLVATIKNEPVGYTLTTFLEPVHISPVLNYRIPRDYACWYQ